MESSGARERQKSTRAASSGRMVYAGSAPNSRASGFEGGADPSCAVSVAAGVAGGFEEGFAVAVAGGFEAVAGGFEAVAPGFVVAVEVVAPAPFFFLPFFFEAFRRFVSV